MPELKKIATIQSGFPTKFGIPKQSNLVENLKSTIIFEPEYRNPHTLRGLESFSHIWLLWGFSKAEGKAWSPTVRPPRLGGNRRIGVFATRSPFRPNPIGLSSVKIAGIEQQGQLGMVIHVLGGDLMDGTPIYDIKPYLPYADCHPQAKGGFTEEKNHVLEVTGGMEWLEVVPEQERENVLKILSLDPRPSYQTDATRVYGMAYKNCEIKFSVDGDNLTIKEIIRL